MRLEFHAKIYELLRIKPICNNWWVGHRQSGIQNETGWKTQYTQNIAQAEQLDQVTEGVYTMPEVDEVTLNKLIIKSFCTAITRSKHHMYFWD